MKIAFALAALMSILPLTLLLIRYEALARIFWITFGAAAFFLASVPLLDIGIISWGEGWTGFVNGIELSALDFLAVIAFFILPRYKTPFIYFIPFILFILAAAISMLQAAEPLAAFFGVWQFVRMLFIAMVVARACAFEEIPHLLLKGIAIGMAVQFAVAIWQRFALGMTQTPGLFIHQNMLGMMAHFVLYPFLMVLFTGGRLSRIATPVVLVTLGCIVLTASRATVGLSAIGIAVAFGATALAGLTQRKMGILALGLILATIATPLAILSLEKRFENVSLTENEYDERAAFNRTADLILQDYPMGVGMNHYTYVAKNLGYAIRAGVVQNEGNINNIVHNAYRLAGAETGYPGLITFCLMLATPMAIAFTAGWRRRGTLDGALLMGFGLALLMAYLHSLFEWNLFAKQAQYMLAITTGLTFGISSRTTATAQDVKVSDGTRTLTIVHKPVSRFPEKVEYP